MNTNKWHNHKIHGRSNRFSKWGRATVGLFALVSATSLQGQDDLPFSSGSTGADGPLEVPPHVGYREGAVMAYDETNEQLVLFGGRYSSTYYPETWVTSDPSLGWERVETATFLSARGWAAMTWDGVNDKLLFFGGYRADGVLMSDTWTFDGTDWTELNVSGPSARYDHEMVTDPATGKIYLVGGRAANNSTLNDIWEWNGTAWTELTEVGTPPAQLNHSYDQAIWNEADNSLILYSSWYRRTWKFKGGTWSEVLTATDPDIGYGYAFVYDPVTQAGIAFGGHRHRGQTWQFKDDEWSLLSTTNTPNRRYYPADAYDGKNAQVVVTNGWLDNQWNGTANALNYDTWAYKNGDWSYQSGRRYWIDMAEKADGIWNYTTIDVPSSAEVRFIKNAANTPVVWLATGAVNINGILRLDGENGNTNDGSDNYALGGPGGAAGGLGAIRFDVSGNYAGTPGQGAGGGAPGVSAAQAGSDGGFINSYGNSLLLPLVGGSGGGGGASNTNTNGGHGGGGGGAILIASSRDLTVNGVINAEGGDRAWGGGSYGGDGSGGAIKLMADRVVGSGSLLARGGRNQNDDSAGRVRIEAFFRPLAANSTPFPSATAPIAAPDFGDLPTLTVVSVDGENVANPPTGNLQTPDVVFTAAGTINIVVDSENIPEGTPVTLRISTSGEIINLPEPEAADITIGADGTATFTADVPAGLGTIQAFSEFTPQ